MSTIRWEFKSKDQDFSGQRILREAARTGLTVLRITRGERTLIYCIRQLLMRGAKVGIYLIGEGDTTPVIKNGLLQTEKINPGPEAEHNHMSDHGYWLCTLNTWEEVVVFVRSVLAREQEEILTTVEGVQ